MNASEAGLTGHLNEEIHSLVVRHFPLLHDNYAGMKAFLSREHQSRGAALRSFLQARPGPAAP